MCITERCCWCGKYTRTSQSNYQLGTIRQERCGIRIRKRMVIKSQLKFEWRLAADDWLLAEENLQ